MVRSYQKKNTILPKYDANSLQLAINLVEARRMSIFAAAKHHNVPYMTLYSRVKGLRGKVCKTKGRPTNIPLEAEVKLANGIRTLEKWGFGLSRKEVMEMVGNYVNKNELKTVFKDGIPGEDWFLSFRRRHNLSLKVPQNVEYARKKATDPFLIYSYFELLNSQLTQLNLHDKPSQIWNLDETSLSIDPRRSRVLGEIGKPSSRTISSPGRENTTVLAMCNAAGGKAPPLIIFKGLHMWDQWLAPEGPQYIKAVYAASKKGWMETPIFQSYFLNTIIPTIGTERPVLIIYDGHSTHIDETIIETAIRENIVILKLPPHSSHILQPLDLSVFKSLKNKWDTKLVAWQRQHVGQKLPKRDFSKFLCETWQSIQPEVIMSGFKKAGIYPFDGTVVPREQFPPEALKRWDNYKNSIKTTGEQEGPNITEQITPTTTQNDKISKSILIEAGPSKHAEREDASTSFEDLLLMTVRQIPVAPKTKKTRVCHGSEVLTSEQVLQRLAQKITKPKSAKKIMIKRHVSFSSSDEEEGHASPENMESDLDDEFIENEVDVHRWLIVKYSTKKTHRHYVGQVTSKCDEGWAVKFTRYVNNQFIWPVVEDTDVIEDQDIVKVLPDPIINRRGSLEFDIQFAGCNLY